jgi:uncharacterized protein (DUF433 family)
MTYAELVAISPDVMRGTPVFLGTSVPIQTLFDYLKNGDSIDQFLDAFPTVKREQVIAFLEAIEARIYQLLLAGVETENGSSNSEQNPLNAIGGDYADSVRSESEAERMAGDFRNDPTWDDFQASIVAYRSEVDAELELEYRQMDEMERQRGSEHSMP